MIELPKFLKLSFDVTNKHIKSGHVSKPNNCAIAKAVKGLGYKDVEVEGTIAFTHNRHEYFVDETDKINNFIDRFDDGKNVNPTHFNLRAKLVLDQEPVYGCNCRVCKNNRNMWNH